MSHTQASGGAQAGLRERHAREGFRLLFQQRMREHLARHGLAAEGFGMIWDKTVRDIHLDPKSQAPLYWELVNWAQSYERFTRFQPERQKASSSEAAPSPSAG